METRKLRGPTARYLRAWYQFCGTSCLIGLCALTPRLALAKSSYYTAAKKAAIATYKYNDLDEDMKRIERRYVPKRVREQAVILGVIVNLVMEQRASFRWEF